MEQATILKVELEDGFHDVPMEDYLSWPFISASALDLLHRRTPAFLKWKLDTEDVDDDSAAKRLGTVTHTAVFEPDLLEVLYMSEPDPDPELYRKGDGSEASNVRNTKAFKDALAQLVEDNPEKTMVEPEKMQAALTMRDAVQGHGRAAQLLGSEGPVEQSIAVTDPDTGVRCKIRPDKLVTAIGAEVNLKTTKNARYDRFSNDIYHFGYYRSAAFYALMLQAIGWDYRRSLFIAVESDGPKSVAVYEMDAGAMDAGEQHAKMLLRRIAKCMEDDHWPTHAEEVQSISLPPHAWDRIDEEVRRG